LSATKAIEPFARPWLGAGLRQACYPLADKSLGPVLNRSESNCAAPLKTQR
jgi:hypothetical protein